MENYLQGKESYDFLNKWYFSQHNAGCKVQAPEPTLSCILADVQDP